MDLEFHQLDLRYDALRTRHVRKERQVLASLADHGQLLPVVVVDAVLLANGDAAEVMTPLISPWASACQPIRYWPPPVTK